MTEKHFIEVENGQKVATVHHKADSDKWVFFCHGFGSNKEGSYEKRAERIVEEGWNAVRFDFRGNGESDGEFIENGLSSKIMDLETVIEHFGPEKYVLFGSSFGGKVVFHGGLELEPEAVIGRAPVTYNTIMDKYKAVVQNKGKFTHHPGATIDQRFYDDFEKHTFDQVIAKLDVPVAIFHGADDTTVHPEHSFKAAESLETDVMIQKLEGEKHSFSETAENYMNNQMISWLHNNGF
jgi:pimeloyl-ACP methyl ester carboxylesterase